MATFGKFDTADFDAFVAEFENADLGEKIVKEVEAALTETAGRAINKVKRKTPPLGTTPMGNPSVGRGTLRRNWQASNVKKAGSSFEIEIYNNTEYAPFVENGHRIVRAGKTVGYVPGVFMLKDTVDEINNQWDKLVGKRFNKAIANILGD